MLGEALRELLASPYKPHRSLTQAQSVEAGGVAAKWGANGDALSCSQTPMIEIDDSALEEDEREFLQRWANALQVPVAVLIIRILSAAIEGDQYIEKRPEV